MLTSCGETRWGGLLANERMSSFLVTSHLQKTSEGQAQKGLRCHLNLVPVSKVKTWTQQAKPVTLTRSPDLLGPVRLGPGLSERRQREPPGCPQPENVQRSDVG